MSAASYFLALSLLAQTTPSTVDAGKGVDANVEARQGAEVAGGTSDQATQVDKVQAVIDEVEKRCAAGPVFMIGRKKAERLAQLVREAKPQLVVECGTALGYSGLWIARELKRSGRGRLVTMEIDRDRAQQAEAYFRKAGLADIVTVKVGDARRLVKEIKEPVDFLFVDCGYPNYYPILTAIEKQLHGGTIVVADNVGVGKRGLSDYLRHVREKYQSRTEWFDVNLPWAKRDAMEISVVGDVK